MTGRVRLDDKVIGPIQRRLVTRAGEIGFSAGVEWRVFCAVAFNLLTSWNRVEDVVRLDQVMYYAGLNEGQGGRLNKHGRRMAREALQALADYDLLDIEPPEERWGRWWVAVPDWALGQPVDNRADDSVRGGVITPLEWGQSPPLTEHEGGQSPPREGAITPLEGGQSPPYYVPKRSEGLTRRPRGRERPVQLQLALVWIHELTGTGLDVEDPVCRLLAELDDDDHQALADLARELLDPRVVDEFDDADLADWIPELLHELYPERIPAPAGIAALAAMPGPVARTVLDDAMPRAVASLTADTGGMWRLTPTGPDDPRISTTLDNVLRGA